MSIRRNARYKCAVITFMIVCLTAQSYMRSSAQVSDWLSRQSEENADFYQIREDAINAYNTNQAYKTGNEYA